MKRQKDQVSDYIKRLKLIYGAILMGPIVTGTIFYLLSKNLGQDLYFGSEFPLIIMLATTSISISIGNFLFKKHISNIHKDSSLEKKLNTFRTTFILRVSLIEGPALASTFIYYGTLNLIYLLMAGALVLYIGFLAPTKEKITMHLNLRGKEKVRFNQLA